MDAEITHLIDEDRGACERIYAAAATTPVVGFWGVPNADVGDRSDPASLHQRHRCSGTWIGENRFFRFKLLIPYHLNVRVNIDGDQGGRHAHGAISR